MKKYTKTKLVKPPKINSKVRTIRKNKRNGGSNEKKNKPRTYRTTRTVQRRESNINEEISLVDFKRKYIIPRIYTKIYEYMDRVKDRDTNGILQDDIMENMNLREIEKIQNLITRMETKQYQEENKIYKYMDYDSVLTSNNRRFTEHDIRIVKCFLLLKKLLNIQKMRLFLPGQLQTINTQEDYIIRLGETKQQILFIMGELDIPIEEEDIIFTNRLDM